MLQLRFVGKLFPGLSPSRLLFTPNFAGRGEYEEAYKIGATVNLDNLYPLERWPEVWLEFHWEVSTYICNFLAARRPSHSHARLASHRSSNKSPSLCAWTLEPGTVTTLTLLPAATSKEGVRVTTSEKEEGVVTSEEGGEVVTSRKEKGRKREFARGSLRK
jgi:hypothetical protein